jgi:hypothetical protein
MLQFSPVSIIPPLLHTYYFVYHRRNWQRRQITQLEVLLTFFLANNNKFELVTLSALLYVTREETGYIIGGIRKHGVRFLPCNVNYNSYLLQTYILFKY